MRLGTRVAAGLALLLSLTVALTAYELLLTRRLHEANRQMASADLEASRTSLRLRRQLGHLSDLTERFLVLRDAGYVEELDRLRVLTAIELTRLTSLVPDLPGSRHLRGPDSPWQAYLAAAAELEPEVVARRESEDAHQRLLSPLGDVQSTVDAVDTAAVERVSQRIATSAATAATARRAALIVSVAGLLLAASLAIWIGYTTAGPLRSLTAGARAMASGDFTQRVEERGPPEIASLAAVFNDMARRLGELDEMKRDFLSNVSHDLKAPLASIQEATQLLLDQKPDQLSEEQRHLLGLNTQSAQRLERMIADLLDVARLEEGSVEFRFEPVDIVDCCDQVLEQAGGLLAAKQIEVKREGIDGPLLVEADPPMLLRALSNLVSNATKFSPKGGTVRVAVGHLESSEEVDGAVQGDQAAPDHPCALLTIADQGPGIPQEDRERIFDRFYRSRAHQRHATGTGLGLAISRSIIETHGGRIWVEGAETGGSVFAVLLPSVVAPRGA